MKLDRNINPDGKGKYALLLLRKGMLLPVESRIGWDGQTEILHYEAPAKMVDLGDTPESEFFLVRLKDKYAAPALHAYADAAMSDDYEWASEVRRLAVKAENHPDKKLPD